MANSKLSIRIDLANGTRFGPGKAALLRALDDFGTISSAAKALGMSYPRALKLIEQMNGAFSAPIVEAQHGGKSGGGAVVTETGREILSLYEQLQAKATAQSAEELSCFASLLK